MFRSKCNRGVLLAVCSLLWFQISVLGRGSKRSSYRHCFHTMLHLIRPFVHTVTETATCVLDKTLPPTQIDYQRQVGSAAVAVVIAAVVTAAAVAAADAATVAVAVAVTVAGPAAAVAAMSSSPLPSPLTRRRRRRRRHRRRRRRRRRRRHRRRPTTIAAVVIAAARPPSHCRRRCRFPPRTYRCPGPCTCRVRARVFACVRAHCVMEASAGSKREGIFS